MRRARPIVLMTIFVLAAVACGDGGTTTTPKAGGTTSPGGTSPQPTANFNNQGTLDATSMSSFSIEMDDSYFKPTFIKAKPGQALNIELEQEGANAHTFTITSLNVDHQLIANGEKKEIDITLPSGSTDIVFFCRFHGESGMQGAFFFGSAPSVTQPPVDGDTNRY
jgi:plastocyanin